MAMTMHGWWTVGHGIILVPIFLLAFASGLMELLTLPHKAGTPEELSVALGRLKSRVWAIAVLVWLMMITGTYVSYPWYRAPSPDSPRSKLLAVPDLAWLHTFAMEWKEHIAWASPILATVVVFIVTYYGAELASRNDLRRAATWFLVLTLAAAVIGGVLGALIYKAVPIL
ncbi:MAG: hypothetical protein DLM73_09665 [Chthoniobacterales bacterium]|nr:MAG: hypothetical protein DLM73_09665 [Chthoniobacterales bacterium]